MKVMTNNPEDERSSKAQTRSDEDRKYSVFRLRSRKLRIEVIEGMKLGRVIEIAGHSVTIGSSRSMDLTLEDLTVSRHHVTLRVDGDELRVIDNGSRNGTTLDGVRIIDAYARPDAIVRVGRTSLRIRLLVEPFDVPLSARESFGDLVGSSVEMRQLYGMLEAISPTDLTVLIEGETGTGKELCAEAIHNASRRAKKPFVVLDGSNVTPNVIEAELFGSAKGAFTGAETRPGRFEEADGGTLFIDEIGEISIEQQQRLLRVLERRQVRRLGENTVRRVNVRVIGATNRNLSVEVERGKFREDLYHRLTEVIVRVPPLRRRLEDLPVLIRRFEAAFLADDPSLKPLPESAFRAFLEERSWSGNVRELRNCVRRAMVLGANASLKSAKATTMVGPFAVDLHEPLLDARGRVADAYQLAHISAALDQTGFNVTRAADMCGVGRRYLQMAMARNGLRKSAR